MTNISKQQVSASLQKARLEVKLSAIAETIVEVTARGERKFTLYLPLVSCGHSHKVDRLKAFFLGKQLEISYDKLGTFIYLEV